MLANKMAAKADETEYDFYLISDDIEWEKQVLQDLKRIKPEIKCLSRKDWKPGEFKVQSLIKPVEKCKKIVVGFTSKPSTGNQEFVAVTAVQQMLNRNLLSQRKLILVKITEDAEIPSYLDPITAANYWEECFYDNILKTLYGHDVSLPSSRQGNDFSPSSSQGSYDESSPPYQPYTSRGSYDESSPSRQPHSSREENLIRKYLLERQQILCSKKKFTPPIMQSRFHLDIAHMFTDLELLKENKEGEEESTPITLKNVLQIIESKPACKTLIDGEGGIGKTSLLRYLAYNWSQKRSDTLFEGKIVFLVNIRDIKKEEDILDVIVKQIPLKDFSRKTNLPKDSKLVEQFIIKHDDEIVLMLDGLDELEKGSESPISIFKKEQLQKSVVLLTSRSENINEFIKESDVHIKVKGFSEDKINEYIKRYFENKSDKGVSLCKELTKFNHRDLYSMCRNPVLLLLTCIMWEENKKIPADKADLFREVFRCILNQYNRGENNPNNISKFEDIPKEYVEAMCALGKCMYNGLKKNQLSINKKDLEANEHVTETALKLGFVYKDESFAKTDFEEIYTAPHKLIVESLVGYYLYKLCENTGLGNLPLLDDKEWKEIRENEHLKNAKEFAIGFLGSNAGKFLKYWITNDLLTYRSLNQHINRVKQEHVGAVIQALTDHMTNSELEISDVCRSLRKFMHHTKANENVDENENIILLIRKIHDTVSRYQIEGFCNEMSPEEKGKRLAHCIIAVKDQEEMLNDITRQCNDEVVDYFVAECEKRNIKYDISNYEFNATTTASYLCYLLTHSPNLKRLSSNNECITGSDINDAMKMCSSRGIELKLEHFRISGNDLSSINGTLLASIVNSVMSKLDIHNCNLTGKVINDMMRECSSRGINLKLRHFNISENDLRSINATSLASIVTHQMSTLVMHNCNLTGDVLNDTMRECSSRGIKLQFVNLYISDNDLNSIKATSLASIVNPQMRILDMHNCNLTGEVINDTMEEIVFLHNDIMREFRRIKLQLVELDISGNDLNSINATSLASIMNPQMTKLDMHNCNLTGDLFNDAMGECRGIKLKLVYLNISGNNISSINATSLTTLLPSQLNVSNCNLTGKIINDTMTKCYNRGIMLELKDLNISGNDLSSINTNSLASIMNFPMSSLDISNCNLTGEVMNDMMGRRSRKGKVEIQLVYFNLSDNDLSSINVKLLASLLPSQLDSLFRPGSKLDMHNCNLTGDVINDMITVCSTKKIKLELSNLNISDNNLSSIDATLLASTMNPQMKLLDMHNR